jgi:hypothetical protein
VMRHFPPSNAGLQLCGVEKTCHLWCHIPGSLSWEPEASTLGARVRQRFLGNTIRKTRPSQRGRGPWSLRVKLYAPSFR